MTQKDYLLQIDSVIANGHFKDNNASLCTHTPPEWYKNAKFGIFIHWGVYSVPGYSNEWYSREMYDKTKPSYRHHIKTYGNQKDFGYKDFIPMFKGENFSADEWVNLFKESGAKYVMPVAEHHDGFAMYGTEFNRWNAVNMGVKRDVVGEIKASCEKLELEFCASNHRAEHFFFMNMGRTIDSDVNDENYADFYGPAYYCDELGALKMGQTTNDVRGTAPTEEFLQDWLVRNCEFVDKYQPSVVYFDWWIHNKAFKPYLKKFAAYYYNRALEWDKEVSINYKCNAFAPGIATRDVERGALTDISPEHWQTCTAIGKNSWGYTKTNNFKTPYHIVTDLIDIVSKNGNMLLNVGPKPDGTITKEETQILRSIGKWLQKNGDGIYDTTAWKTFGEGKVNAKDGFFQDNKTKPYKSRDFRFTYKNGCVYAFWMKPNSSKSVRIKTFKKINQDLIVKRVTQLDSGEELSFVRGKKYMEFMPNGNADYSMPLCFKIELE